MIKYGLKIVILLILLAGITGMHASAQTEQTFSSDKKLYEQGQIVGLMVTNSGKEPIYILDKLYILSDNSEIVDMIQDFQSSTILKLYPGKSYTWQYNSNELNEGIYKGKIYVGDNKKILSSIYTQDFVIQSSVKLTNNNVRFYTNKNFYRRGETIAFTIKNFGSGTIYVPNVFDTRWEISRTDGTIQKVFLPLEECEFGYGCGGADWITLESLESFTLLWNQNDNNGNPVSSGRYKATATYTDDQDDPTIPISTKVFTIGRFAR